jgi:hypothetical protein
MPMEMLPMPLLKRAAPFDDPNPANQVCYEASGKQPV